MTVTFHPDCNNLTRQLQNLQKVSKEFSLTSIIVDNGSDENEIINIKKIVNTFSRLDIVFLKENIGLSAAQNVGIKYAKNNNFSHILLMDQDSLPAENMVKQLVKSWNKLSKKNLYLAAVGPNYKDLALDNPVDFVRLKGFGIYRVPYIDGINEVRVDYLIASGSLISLSAIECVGDMRSDLFIDYIDIEWGLRAKRLGWLIYGIFDAKMSHSLGDKVISIFGRRIPLHDPIRNYFAVRNSLVLLKDKSLPITWRYPNILKLPVRLMLYIIFGDRKVYRLKMILYGIVDAFRFKMGKPAWLK
nr:glycosyltransferase family 2 protein [Ferrovum sp. PN-J185]